MMLLDTNVLIYASSPESPFFEWARTTIAEAVAGDGAAIDSVALAEICVGDAEPTEAAERIRGWGVAVLDTPAAAASRCGAAYRLYLTERASGPDAPAPRIPLPDFFIGAHAAIMGWTLATADRGRFAAYFPDVTLETPY